MELRIGKRIEEKLIKIPVNSYDDCIYINVNDAAIFDRFAEFLDWLDKKSVEIEAKEKEIRGKYTEVVKKDNEGNPVDIDINAFMEISNLRTSTYRENCERLDLIFGKDTCYKYFRVMYEANPGFVPDDECIYDFLEEITPVMNQLFDGRIERIKLKYSKTRKGGKANRYRTKEQLISDYKGK